MSEMHFLKGIFQKGHYLGKTNLRLDLAYDLCIAEDDGDIEDFGPNMFGKIHLRLSLPDGSRVVSQPLMFQVDLDSDFINKLRGVE